MPDKPRVKTEGERTDEVREALQSSAAVQEEAAGVLRQVAARLDELSQEMRKHGAFPIVGQIERERREVESAVNKLSDSG